MRLAGLEPDAGAALIQHGFRLFQEKTMKMFKQFFALAMICEALTTLTACNTMAGAGKDVEKAGQKVEQKAEDCKDAKC